jgi:predicted transcriptional regulator
MPIELNPEQQRVIDLAIRSGACRNPGEVLDQAFAIIREQLDLEDWMIEQREAVAAHIETGFAQAGRGELLDGESAIEMLRQRRIGRLNPPG